MKCVYLIYGTYVDSPWHETLLAIVDSEEKAKHWIKTVCGEWERLHYKIWDVQ